VVIQTWLSCPGIVCALGEGLPQVAACAFAGDSSGMQVQNGWLAERPLTLGGFNGALPAITDKLPPYYHSRNNQLLLAAYLQIEEQVRQAINRYGANRVAVVLGTSTSAVNDNIPAFNTLAQQGAFPADYEYRKQELCAPAAFLSTYLGTQNLAYTLSTACTSSARALLSAQRLLQLNLCDAVLCGGADNLCRLTINGFAALEAVDETLCCPFSKNRRGINIGEAAVLFVMTREKPKSPAIAFLGGAGSSDAYHMSTPEPNGAGAQAAIRAALKNAQISTEEVGWVNLHGTATPHNDAMESHAMQAVFPQGVPCASTKALSGHALGTAAALEAALVWAALSAELNPEGRLIPHIWDGEADPSLPALDLTDSNYGFKAGKPRIAISNSFAFGGNNVSLIFADSA